MTDSTVQGSMGSIQPWGGVILNHMVVRSPRSLLCMYRVTEALIRALLKAKRYTK